MQQPFKPLSHFEQVDIHTKSLPHWRQQGVTYFVTSRLWDSIPKQVMELWLHRRKAWLISHGLETPAQVAGLPGESQLEYHRLFTDHFYDLLDTGHGSCCLGEAGALEILSALFVQGHPERYSLDAWVIMPNHFHVLITPHKGIALGQVTRGWTGSSARSINILRGRSGRFWQPEGFDHIVRSRVQFQHYRDYIASNPEKANLRRGCLMGFGGESGLSIEIMNSRINQPLT